MKFKRLAVIILLVLGCSFLSAQTFGFLSVGGGEYCNYIQLQKFGGAIWQGTDNLSACGLPIPLNVNGTIAGVTASISEKNNPVRIPINGVAYADSLYDASNYQYTGIQWFVLTDLKVNPGTPKYGWVGFASISGFIYGANYGYLTTTIPDVKNESPRVLPYVLSNGQKMK